MGTEAAHAPRLSCVPLVIGHRGAPGYRPEHTASSYRLACGLGVDAVEPDLVVSRDGVLVVRHENEISSTTDVKERAEFANRRTTKLVDGKRITGWFTEDFSWAELATLRCRERLPEVRPKNLAFEGERILRLRDVMAIVTEESTRLQRPIQLVIEIKHAHYFLGLGHDLAELLRKELAAHPEWRDRERLVIESFELGVLERLRDLPARFVFLAERSGAPADDSSRSYAGWKSEEGLDVLADRVDGVSVAKSDVLRKDGSGATELVQRIRARGLLAYVWTLRPENRFLNAWFRSKAGGSDREQLSAEWGDWRGEFELLLGTGADGIFVDHPDLAITASDELAQDQAAHGAP